MSELRRYQSVGAVFSESLSSLQYVRKNYTVNGNPTIVDSPFGKAMSFDGSNDSILINDISEIDDGVYTEIYLIYPNAFSIGMNEYIVDKSGNNNWIQLYDSNNNGKPLIRAGSSAGSFTDSSVELESANRWYSIIITRSDADSGTIKIYLDGVEVANTTSKAPTNPGNIKLGGFSVNNSLNFNGYIKNMIIIDRVLTAQEISDIHTGKAFDYARIIWNNYNTDGVTKTYAPLNSTQVTNIKNNVKSDASTPLGLTQLQLDDFGEGERWVA